MGKRRAIVVSMLLLAGACSSFSGTDDGAPSDAGPEASGDAAIEGDAVASDANVDAGDAQPACDGSWCACHPHKLCEDFDDGKLLDQLTWKISQASASVSLDDAGSDAGDLTSPPFAARFDVPLVDGGGQKFGEAYIHRSLSGAVRSVTCSFSLRIRAREANTNAFAFYLRLEVLGPHPASVSWQVPTSASGPNGSKVTVYGAAPDGGPAPETNFPLPFLDGVWARYAFELVGGADGGASHLTVKRDGALIVDGAASELPADNTGIDVALGLGGLSFFLGGTETLIDDVACDTQ